MLDLGRYTPHVIETGRFGLDGGAMFGIVPKPLWTREIEPDDANRISLAARCLLLEGRDRLILIDAGLGEPPSEKFAEIFAVDREHSELHRSLEEAGFEADDVTDVIITHLHFDHCGGTTEPAGEGEDGEPSEWQLTFQHARHHVQRRHWEWARTSNPKEKNSFRAENIDPLADSGSVQLVEGAEEILPGIEALPVDGHTEGQQMIKVDPGAGDTLVFVADLLPTTRHFEPAWTMAYDVRPMTTIEEKRDFLDEAERAGWTLFFEHDPDTAAADLKRTEEGIEPTDLRPTLRKED